jgi:hypothetical protein
LVVVDLSIPVIDVKINVGLNLSDDGCVEPICDRIRIEINDNVFTRTFLVLKYSGIFRVTRVSVRYSIATANWNEINKARRLQVGEIKSV